MTYRLTMQGRDGSLSYFFYDPHASTLTDEAGNPVPLDYDENAASIKWPVAIPVSPDSPGKKHAAPVRLKIQLGLQCNYSCSYCLQSSEIPDATVSNVQDAEDFLASLDSWLKSKPNKIEFWGGEPFAYWKHMKVLVPAMRERFPDASMLIVTNGSVLDDEKIDFIEEHGIYIAVSHDAKAQHRRGPDPFDDPEKAAMLRKLWQRIGRKGMMSFNTVITPENLDVDSPRQWLSEKIGETVMASFEGIVHPHSDGRTEDATWTQAQYSKLQWNIINALVNRTPGGYDNTIAAKAAAFIDSLRKKRPSTALWQKCGMDRPDQLAVDLKGNVMTCQNVGAKGKHGVGHVSDFESIALDTSWHWSKRPNCAHCPVLQLCGGACMYQDGVAFDVACENEFQFNTAVMSGALYWITGKIMVHIDGDIRRPKLKKVIPIKAA